MQIEANGDLSIDRCPHCWVAKPVMTRAWDTRVKMPSTGAPVLWFVFQCRSCSRFVLAHAQYEVQGRVDGTFPETKSVDATVPERARDFLTQAMCCVDAPAGAVMLAASAIDAMLKEKGYQQGHLNPRIDQAAKDHLITDEMAAWAHEIRLDANDQRHADAAAPLPNEADARKVIDFAAALAQFLFVLPARVQRGRKTKAP